MAAISEPSQLRRLSYSGTGNGNAAIADVSYTKERRHGPGRQRGLR